MIKEEQIVKEYHFLNPISTVKELELGLGSLNEHEVNTVIVPPLMLRKAVEKLQEKQINIATIVGLPYGFNAIESKLSDIILAMVDGAKEMLVALNMTALKNADWQYLAKELSMLLQVVKAKERKLSIVVNFSLLTNDEIIKCCDLYGVAGIDSFTLNVEPTLPSLEQIQLIRKHLADAVQLRIFVNNAVEIEPLCAAGITLVCGELPVK